MKIDLEKEVKRLKVIKQWALFSLTLLQIFKRQKHLSLKNAEEIIRIANELKYPENMIKNKIFEMYQEVERIKPLLKKFKHG